MTAPASAHDRTNDFDLLNPHAQESLRGRVDAAGGDIERVQAEVQQQLDAIDQGAVQEGASAAHQADRAFLVGQIAYLAHLARERAAQARPARQGVLARLRSIWRSGASER